MYVTEIHEDNLDKYEEPRIHMERLMRAKLVEFDLSLRILIPLESAGIRTLGDLVSKQVGDIRKIKSIGASAVDKLTAFLTYHGLSFGMKQ